MELNSIEKICSEAPDDQKYYAFNRVSTYDPNMCSTARFSPPYDNDESAEAQENDTYGNVILIPCTTSETDAHLISRPINATTGISASYTVPVSDNVVRFARNCVTDDHPHFPSVQNEQLKEQFDPEQIEPQMAQIVLRQSPNGTLYQNYYIASNVNVELVDNSGCETGRSNFVSGKENERISPVEYTYNAAKVTHGTEIIGHIGDGHFVQLDPGGLMPVHTQEEFLTTTYNTIQSSNGAVTLQDKDPQRLLLESTMSPLLAAVNDITQRDAELQSYLSQALEKGTALDDCQRTYRFRGHRSKSSRDDDENHVAGNYSKTVQCNIQNVEEEDDDVLLVADKPVETRALASLPTMYLYFGNSSDKATELSVFAKRQIPLRTKFGPFEGEMQSSSDFISDILLIQASNTYPLLLVNNTSLLDVTNENACNWMRFVRIAKNYTEQNLLLFEESGKLFFRSCQVIHARQELRVGYSETYAKHYDLKILTPTEAEAQDIYNREHPWPCFECGDRFTSSKELQEHLNVHDFDDDLVKPKISRKKKKVRNKRLIDIRKNSIRCLYCNKVFMTSSSLKKHVSNHFNSRRVANNRESSSKTFRCTICDKKYTTEDKLKTHRIMHIKDSSKRFKCPRCNRCCSTPTALTAHIASHSLRYFSCVFCPEKFTNVSIFRRHRLTHSVNGSYICQWCKKKYAEYHLVRKHIRVFHQSLKYPCNECGRNFATSTFLKRHKVSHSEKCEYLCSQCGKQFKRKDKLREHIQRIHSEKRKQRANRKLLSPMNSQPSTPSQQTLQSRSSFEDWSPMTLNRREERNFLPKPDENYRNFLYKCDECMLGFKRRGMLVNHMTKRHPDVPLESIPELNMPILKPQSLFFCQYCSKVYKSNAKRKFHILKNHPGQELPPPARCVAEPSQMNARTVGNLPTEPYRCHWCYKQYAARNRLVFHHRKAHPHLELVPSGTTTLNQSREYFESSANTFASGCAPTGALNAPMDVYRPPGSPENKLLKLSSAALELSSIEDRQFFDFLNEKSQFSLQEQTTLPENHSHDNLNLDDNGNGFSKVDVNFKVVESEFGESSSNGELNRLPQLFEESIACI